MNNMNKKILKTIDNCEDSFINLFSTHYKFSKNLIKYVDDEVYDMYDHNYFKPKQGVTNKEIEKAYMYQYDNRKDFLKIISSNKLSKNIIKEFNLDESTILTMLYDNKTNNFKINEKVIIKDITLKDLNTIELKHYGKIYGNGFVKRRNKEFMKEVRSNPNFRYLGAYINGKIVGSCYAYTYKDITCIDSLLVDNRHRKRGIASTLIKNIVNSSKNTYLHADLDDKPKDIYAELGFKVVNKYYDYYRKITWN